MTKKNKETGIGDLRIKKSEMTAIALKDEINKLFYAKSTHETRMKELEMMKHQFDNEEEERLGLHASSVIKTGNFCYREQLINILYKYYKEKNPNKIPRPIYHAFQAQLAKNRSNPIHLQRIFEQGKAMGFKWQMMFIRAGIGKKEDMDIPRFVEEYDLSYTPDGAVNLLNKKWVVELKSQNNKRFTEDSTHRDGIRQLKLYMYFENIPQGFVLVDNKDNSDFKVLVVENVNESDPDIATALDRLEKLQRMKKKALKHKKMPPCPCKKCSK